MCGDTRTEAVARRCGGVFIWEPGPGVNEALTYALDLRGTDRASSVVLAASLPLLTLKEVGMLVDASNGGQVAVVAPAHDEEGTNALVIPDGCVFHPSFGHQSRRRHRILFERQGYRVQELLARGLAFDVDTPAHLADLRLRASSLH